jgi:hypothetical protein
MCQSNLVTFHNVVPLEYAIIYTNIIHCWHPNLSMIPPKYCVRTTYRTLKIQVQAHN